MYEKHFVDLALYRMEMAEEALEDAQDAISRERFRNAANRSYYAIFNAMRAMLNLEGKDYKRHSGVIAEFRREFIKTGVFDKALSVIIRKSFDIRNASDYENFYVVSKQEVVQQTENAAVFVDAVKRCLMERIS